MPGPGLPERGEQRPGATQHHAVGQQPLPLAVPVGAGRDPRGGHHGAPTVGVDEVLVLQPEHGPAAHAEVSAPGEPLRVETGRPVERLGHRRAPVDHERLVVGARDGQAADVEGLTERRARCATFVGVGQPVDAPEVERLVTDVELLQAGQAGPHHDVALGAGLKGAPPPEVQDALQHLARLAPHELQPVVGTVEELLLILQVGMFGHLSPFSPLPRGKRFSLDAPHGPERRGSGRGDAYDERTERTAMLISTMNDVPGYKVTSVLGEVFGLTVRSRNVGSQFGAAFKSLAGGELKGMTKNLQLSREDVVNRMVTEAEARGGNAVLAMRFDTSEMGGNWTEICAYGTAVVIEPLG